MRARDTRGHLAMHDQNALTSGTIKGSFDRSDELVAVLTTLEAIVDRLVTGYAPDRIVLFGSRATGAGRRDSDIDLLIVKETDRRPVDRRIEVERLLADRGAPPST